MVEKKNKLLQKVLSDVFHELHKKGEDVRPMAGRLNNFMEKIRDDDALFEGYKLYSLVSREYSGRLGDLGLLDDKVKNETQR